jgi:hypothetical protein
MATLTATAPLSIDQLLNRARARASAPSPRKPPAPRIAEPLLDDTPNIPAAPPSERPTALVLCVSILTCACGTVHRVPAAYALARYEVNANSFRFSRAELDRDTVGLPRSIREVATSIPFCERCF